MKLPDSFKEWQDAKPKLSPIEEIEREKYETNVKKFYYIYKVLFKNSMALSFITSLINFIEPTLITVFITIFFILIGGIFYHQFIKFNKRYIVINVSDEEYFNFIKKEEEEMEDYYYYCRIIFEQYKNKSNEKDEVEEKNKPT